MAYDVEAGAELVDLVPEFWDSKLEKYRYQKSVMLNRVSSKSDFVKARGDTVHVFIKGRYTATAVTPGTGAFTVQEYTPPTVNITVDQWFVVPIEVVNKAAKQSVWDPKSSLPEEAAEAFAERYDTDLLALGSTISAVGDAQNPKQFDKKMAAAMYIRLAKRNIPKTDLSFVIPEEGMWDGLIHQQEFTDASQLGVPKSILTTGFVFPILGVPVYTTNLCAKAATPSNAYQGLLFHKSAYAIAMQINNHYEEASAVSAGRLAKIVEADTLYGTQRIRGDHVVVGYVKEYVESQVSQ